MKFRIADCGLRIGWVVASALQILAVFPLITVISSTLRAIVTLFRTARVPSGQNVTDLLAAWGVCIFLSAIAFFVLSLLKKILKRHLDAGRDQPLSWQSAIRNPQSTLG